MKYNWDFKDISNQKKILKQYLKNNDNLSENEVDSLIDDIRSLRNLQINLLFKLEDFNLFSLNISKKSKIATNYTEYLEIPDSIKAVILDSISNLHLLDNNYGYDRFSSLDISNDDLIAFLYDFIESLPTNNPIYIKLFLKYTDVNNHLLRFFSNRKKDGYKVLGYSNYIAEPVNKPYILICRTNTIEDFLTFAHELFHAIFFQGTNRNSMYRESIYLYELEGCFIEFLVIRFFNDKLCKKVINNLEYNRFYMQYYNMKNFYISHLANEQYLKNKKIFFDEICEEIDNSFLPFSCDCNEIKSILASNNPNLLSIYLLSYFTSLDLESLYQYDPEYSFYLFEQIRNNKEDSVITNLRNNHITFMDDGYKSLQKKIGEINSFSKKEH